MNILVLATAVLSINSSMHLINGDLGYLSDTDVANFRTACLARGLTSFETHSTDGNVRQIKCFSQEMTDWEYVDESS